MCVHVMCVVYGHGMSCDVCVCACDVCVCACDVCACMCMVMGCHVMCVRACVWSWDVM